MRQWRIGVAMVIGLLVATVLAGCAQERDPIDRVQPNAIKKSMLNGEWFFHQKVVDVPGGHLEGFLYPSVVGMYADPYRVRFDIQEKFLYVRRVNEIVFDAETYSQEYEEDWSTFALLAAYRIEKHFDVQRDYNPVTGESYNVVSENTMDRPWWEREYLRVDWSTNLAPSLEFGYGAALTVQTPVPYYVQDECTPDLEFAADPRDRCVPGSKAPFFDIVWREDGSGLEKGYFDITTSFVTTPGTTYLEGYGELPSCWLFEYELMECVPTMYFVRNSFWLNDPEKRDYEPLPTGGNVTSQFGFFMKDYLHYDSQQAVVEPSRAYMLERHNLWEQSHSWNKVDPESGGAVGINWELGGDELFNPDNRLLCRTTADCCPGYNAADPSSAARCDSVCDVYIPLRPSDRGSYEEKFGCKFRVTPQNLTTKCAPTHYCTLPYNERRVRPMVYYANAEWPEELARHPSEPRYVPPTEDTPGIWGYDVEHEPEDASVDAWTWAMADEPRGETRPMLEKVGDRWNAAFTRVVNILKRKASGVYSPGDANVPYIDDDMRRREGGQGAFSRVAPIPALVNDHDMRGFDEHWYDPDRPPYAICRFSPVLGPDNDPHNVEPDICWERIQELSHCVFNPDNPGINPRTGQVWEEARNWPLCTLREAMPRLGDIRYSFAYWVDKWYEGFRLLGLGPGHSDLNTGETLAGTAHMYMHNDMYARSIVDQALLLTGDIGTGEYIDGYNLLGWRNRFTGSGTNPMNSAYTAGGGAMAGGSGGYSAADITSQAAWMRSSLERSRKFDLTADQISAIGESHMPVHGSATGSASDLVYPFTADDLLRAAAQSYDATGGYLSDDIIRSIADHPSGGAIEEMLIHPQGGQLRTMLAGSGFNPTYESNLDSLSEDIKDKILITRRDPFKLAQVQESMQAWLETEFRADFAGPVDDVASSTAYEIQRLRAQGRLPKPGDSGYSKEGFVNAVWRMTRKKVLHSVTMHEIGHSVGLRHNFAGSQDFINYFEDYWKIRTSGCADITTDHLAPSVHDMPEDLPWDEANQCGNPDGGRVGPRFVEWREGGDPMSQYELFKQLYNYSYSAVMDYGKAHTDQYGIGRYEWAALLYGYGHHFEVYREDGYPTGPYGSASWKNHPWYRPGYATAGGTATRIVEDHLNKSIVPSALVPNHDGQIPVLIGKTGQRLCADQNNIGDTYIDLIACNPGEPPCIVESWNDDGSWVCAAGGLSPGDKFSVWGWPIRFNQEELTGWTIKDMLESYQRGNGNPLVFFFHFLYAPHYTQWVRNWPDLGFNTQSNRDVRDIRNFDWRVRSQGNSWDPGFNLRGGDEAIRVPYAYCTDNQVNISNDCRARSIGADDWERMHYHIADWDQWYISRSFIRQRVGMRPDRYPSSWYRRIYRAPKDYNNIYTLYQEILSPLYSDPRQIDTIMTDPYNAWGGFTMALHDGFNMLWQTIAAPDSQSPYQVRERPENSEFALDADLLLGFTGNMGFDIASGGRVFETRYGNYNYDQNCGNTFWRCLWNVGYYYDKVMAINALSQSATYFVGRDTAHDVRLYRVSFFDNFNWQIKKYFSAMMGENWGDWAPVVAMSRDALDTEVLESTAPILPSGLTQPKLFWRNWANPTMDITNPWVYLNNRDWGTATNFDPMEFIVKNFGYEFTPIEPVASFTVQVYAMVLGMARFSHNYDFSFYNTARMWQAAAGSLAAYDSEGGSINQTVHYFDKENQIVYSGLAEYGVNEVFHPYTTEEETGMGVAASMIRYANAMKSRSAECDADGTTPWTDDDCCDNPYEPQNPDEPENFCPAIPEYPVSGYYSDEVLAQINARLAANRETVTNSLKKYKGLLDFQVRLTNVYDQYLGMTGPEYDPGSTPGE